MSCLRRINDECPLAEFDGVLGFDELGRDEG